MEESRKTLCKALEHKVDDATDILVEKMDEAESNISGQIGHSTNLLVGEIQEVGRKEDHRQAFHLRSHSKQMTQHHQSKDRDQVTHSALHTIQSDIFRLMAHAGLSSCAGLAGKIVNVSDSDSAGVITAETEEDSFGRMSLDTASQYTNGTMASSRRPWHFDPMENVAENAELPPNHAGNFADTTMTPNPKRSSRTPSMLFTPQNTDAAAEVEKTVTFATPKYESVDEESLSLLNSSDSEDLDPPAIVATLILPASKATIKKAQPKTTPASKAGTKAKAKVNQKTPDGKPRRSARIKQYCEIDDFLGIPTGDKPKISACSRRNCKSRKSRTDHDIQLMKQRMEDGRDLKIKNAPKIL